MEYNSIFNGYVLGRAEEYDTEKLQCWSFKKVTDIVKGVECRFSNMAGGFPFEFGGRTWQNSEVLYLCGEFSNDTEQHRQIQSRLTDTKSGYAAKRFVKTPNKRFVREDFATFRLQWMLFVVWQKCKGNADFRSRLLQVPDGVVLIEDTTTDNGGSAEIWGCRNKEQLAVRKEVMPIVESIVGKKGSNKKEREHLVNCAINEFQAGVFRGQNNIGKILMMCRTAIKLGVEPPIDYDLLERSNIYIFGERLEFTGYNR